MATYTGKFQILNKTTTLRTAITPLTGQLCYDTDLNSLYIGISSAWVLVKADAIKIGGRAMASTAPTDGQVVIWDNGGSTWKPGTWWDEQVFGDDAAPITANQTVTVVRNTIITLYYNAATPNLRINYSGTAPIIIQVYLKNKQGSGTCAMTVSLNSATPWTGVLRSGGLSPVFTTGADKIDQLTLIYTGGSTNALAKLDLAYVSRDKQ